MKEYPYYIQVIKSDIRILCPENKFQLHLFFGTKISSGCKFWLEKFGVLKYKTKNSLYKCFLCDKGELTPSQVDSILEIAKNELGRGID